MKTRTEILAAAALLWLLAGCAPAVMGPTVIASPGPGKTPANFASDHAACSAAANQQIAPMKMSANNQVVASVLTSDVATAAATAQSTTALLQQQFDIAYSGCMYAAGETVPGYVVADDPVSDLPRRRRPVRKPASAGFVEPAPSAQPVGAGFSEPPAAR